MRAQQVLDVELALATAAMLEAELRQLVDEDVDAARRARLQRMIEKARAAVEARLRRGSA